MGAESMKGDTIYQSKAVSLTAAVSSKIWPLILIMQSTLMMLVCFTVLDHSFKLLWGPHLLVGALGLADLLLGLVIQHVGDAWDDHHGRRACHLDVLKERRHVAAHA